MKARWMVVALSTCASLVICPWPLNSQDTNRPTGGPKDVGDASHPPRSSDSIRAFLNGARGSLKQPEDLAPFFERLYRVSVASSAESAHILHFGDSHTAGDEWTGRLRSLFQDRFGDGGSGFSLPGHPFAGYRRIDAAGGSTGNWRAAGVQTGTGDSYFGLGGVSLSTDRPGQAVFLNAQCDGLELHYLQQPNGGSLALYEDGQLVEEFSTAGDTKAEARDFPTRPGVHRYMLKTMSSRPVQLFGWVADKRHGVTYESLGLNGARAPLLLHADEQMLARYLEGRDPALIVLAYGTNDAVELQSSVERYQEMFSTLLARLRSMAPNAAILVIGPPDVSPRSHGGVRSAVDVGRVAAAAQERASRSNGCAFWDMREHMGGQGSMREWAAAGLAQRDYVHFSAAGYHQLANALFADLMRYYTTYAQVRLQLVGRDSNE